MKKTRKPRFVVVKNLETTGPHTFWDVVEVKTKNIIFSGFYSRDEAEQQAELLNTHRKFYDAYIWHPKYKGSLDV